MFTDATFCNEYERWLDKLAQNAPEGVQMEQIDYADTLTTAIQNAGGGYVYYPSYGVPDEAVNKFVASGLLKRGDGDSVTAGENFYTAASEPELWETYPPGWDTVEDEPEINPQTGWVRKTEAERVTFNANMADMLIGRIAALLNIDGKFAVDYGTSQIEDAIKAQAAEIERLKAERDAANRAAEINFTEWQKAEATIETLRRELQNRYSFNEPI